MRASEHPAFADPRYETVRSPTSNRRLDTAGRPPESDLDNRLPSGEELVKGDRVRKSKADSLREALFDELEDETDALKEVSNSIKEIFSPPGPEGQYTQARSHDTTMHAPQPAGVDAGMTAAAMFATGLVIGELARRAYRKGSDLKERWHARNG